MPWRVPGSIRPSHRSPCSLVRHCSLDSIVVFDVVVVIDDDVVAVPDGDDANTTRRLPTGSTSLATNSKLAPTISTAVADNLVPVPTTGRNAASL